MPDLLLPSNGHYAPAPSLQDVLWRLERLEMAAGLMAQALAQANLPPLQKAALHTFALSVIGEKKKRDGK